MRKRRKIPTKAELLQLQKLYKTDERIGERLGGVPAYLVAYWRRKKNIPKYSLPKFSETEIRTLWERYGDDEKAGLELGISKAAFYNWRRRYGFREKPAFLKLEQLELNFPGSGQSVLGSPLYGKRSVAQKIIAQAADVERVEVGEEVEIEPDLVISSSEAGKLIELFKKRRTEFVWNPGKVLVALDFYGRGNDGNTAANHKIIREFARRQGIKTFYDLREGSPRQIALERGHVRPGQIVLGSVDVTESCGAMAAMASTIDVSAMDAIWAGGRHTVTVPQTARVTLIGRRSRGVHATDVALSIGKQVGHGAVSGMVLEYAGSAISQMSIGERFTLCDLSVATGAAAIVCAYDATTRRFLTGRTMSRYQPLVPDKDAEYRQLYQINIDQLGPQIARKGSPEEIRAVAEVEGQSVQQIVIGGATSGRYEDLRATADVLRNRRVHEDCRLVIVPASHRVYLEALKKGLIRLFLEAGATVLNPGFCTGFLESERCVADGECCLSTSNVLRYYSEKGQSREVYICSPSTAAASAVNGTITDPIRYVR
ncbi:MAG: hypothetical protein DRP45_05025 [Candidatus Zixiibacteriota bacterium]|nr:MAG: hypothetical protein DRP45_05025 [candidate division Zixibacteria bacterium]